MQYLKFHFIFLWLLPLLFPVRSNSQLLGSDVPEENGPVDYVNPYIGHISHLLKPTQPAVHLPNSFMCLTPDRGDYTRSNIHGLPLLRSGRYYSAFHMSPFQGDVKELKPVVIYKYDQEKVTPYSYSVELSHGDIEVDFGLSHQSAMYKIKFHQTEATYLILNSNLGELKWDGESISGYQELKNGVRAYLYLKPDRTPENVHVLDKNELKDGNQAARENACLVLGYPPESEINIRYGISFIDVKQAQKNLEREVGLKNMETLHSEGRKIWNETLGKIEVQGCTSDEKSVFYTALYRNYRFPVSISEDNRYFSPFDGKIHEDQGVSFYSGTHDSGWNSYLGVRPLGVLIEPEREAIILSSILQIASQLETFRMPRYLGITGHKVGMISNHNIISFLDAYAKGVKNINLELAFEAGKSAVMNRTLAPVSDEVAGELNVFYQENGYVPALWEGQKEKLLPQVKPFTNRMAVAVTLNTAHDDWALAQMAKETGEYHDYQYFCNRSFNYRNLFNLGTGFFHPRDKNGRFIRPIDYTYSGGLHGRDFYDESNGWIYRFRLQYNIDDLIRMMGGRKAFVSNLDELFAKPFPEERQVQLYRYHNQTGIVGHFSMGNEPSFHIPYLYNYAGEPWKTQKYIRNLMKQWFRNDLLGLPGDEDSGALSAFAVFSAIGIYPMTPGLPVYTIGSPLFKRIKLRLGAANDFEIIAKNNSSMNKYIQSAMLNGKTLDRPWLTHFDIIQGGKLELIMGPRPNKKWGSNPSSAPPSSPLTEVNCSDYKTE